MHSWIVPLLIAVGVVTVIVKRFRGEPLNARDLCGPPLVLTGIGVYGLTKIDGLTATDIAWIAGAALVGVFLGAVRGATIKVYGRGGVPHQRYTVWTIVVWLGAAAVNVGVGSLALAAGMNPEGRAMTLSIGVGMLGEMIVVGLRALRAGGGFARYPASASSSSAAPSRYRM